jgi:hypothetical protein
LRFRILRNALLGKVEDRLLALGWRAVLLEYGDTLSESHSTDAQNAANGCRSSQCVSTAKVLAAGFFHFAFDLAFARYP